jgi:ferric-dicitrate binding protein FerR (iron transport regulator)
MIDDASLRQKPLDEQELADVVRLGGPRPQPRREARDAVRNAVESEWRAVVAARRRVRRRTSWSLAAAAAVAGLAVWLGAPLMQPTVAAVATVARVTGPVTVEDGAWLARPAPASVGATIGLGAKLRSGPNGRLALQVGTASVRLDADSVATLVAADRIALSRGAIYVDSGANGADSAALVVETPLGAVEHVGTQYETRLAEDVLRVMVREGRVRLARDGAVLETPAGEQLTVNRAGDARRQNIGPRDAAWSWVEQVAPAFDIDNRPLPEFLGWVSRETGREIEFASADAQRAAAAVVLRGSVAELSPTQALAAVVATTSLVLGETPDGGILIATR